MERWRIMEEFENIAQHGAVDPGDLINKLYCKALTAAGLVGRNRDGDCILTEDGKEVWARYKRIDAQVAIGVTPRKINLMKL